MNSTTRAPNHWIIWSIQLRGTSPRRIAVFAALLSFALGCQAGTPRLSFAISEDGLYGASPAQLELFAGGVPPKTGWTLYRYTEPVPIFPLERGEAGLSEGKQFAFLGVKPRGENTAVDRYNSTARYALEPTTPGTTTGEYSHDLPPLSTSLPISLWAETHLEEDHLRVSPNRGGKELWVWQRLVQGAAPDAFSFELQAPSLAPDEHTVTLNLDLVGGSNAASSQRLPLPDHQLEVLLNGKLIDEQTWSGRGRQRIEIRLPANTLHAGANRLVLRVPSRLGTDGALLPDTIYLDRINLRYRHSGILSKPQQRLLPVAGARNQGRVMLESQIDKLLAVDGQGRRLPVDSTCQPPPTAAMRRCRFHIGIDQSTKEIWVADASALLVAPLELRPAPHSGLPAPDEPLDYIMLVPQYLRETLSPLANFHRDSGLKVTVVDVETVYGKYNGGRRTPEAIRLFLREVWNRQDVRPPRYLLLVGDASWLGNVSNADSARDIIPSWEYLSTTGPAASDFFYADLSTVEPGTPQLAVGRLPVATTDELQTVIEKTLTHLRSLRSGSAKGNVLLAGDGEIVSTTVNARLAATLNGKIGKVDEFSARNHQAQSLETTFQQTLNSQYSLVHFHGHGGRTSWQVGSATNPRAPLMNLLRAQNLDGLDNGGALLPVVLSMSCATAPFDHPSAGSLGEALLTIPRNGAVAVVAASARNRPPQVFAERFALHLMRGNTVGDAMVKAKRETGLTYVNALYNLLGDPALRAVPAQP